MGMINLYEDIRSNLHYNKFVIGDILFAEYSCPLEQNRVGIYSHMDYMVHVISGKKIWHTTGASWSGEAGQTLFFKKGAAFIEQFFDEDFCLLGFFLPDKFIADIVRELASEIKSGPKQIEQAENEFKTALRVNNDTALSAFFRSMLEYFSAATKPPEHLLKLKLRELIISILFSESNPALSAYFRSRIKSDTPSIPKIMEANFRYNLSLEQFAEMCHRSLSSFSFKRDFQKYFNETPGRWLLQKRLEYAANLLRISDMNISQIVFESGFEDLSHFSKVFKSKFGSSPRTYRSQINASS